MFVWRVDDSDHGVSLWASAISGRRTEQMLTKHPAEDVKHGNDLDVDIHIGVHTYFGV